MTEENYKNGDMYWNMHTGVFKAYDKDGNEVKFPTDDLSYEVKSKDVEKGKIMDKEIIIDDVNVAGCEFFDSGCCRECDMRVPFYNDIDCDDRCNHDCYYKQLQKLKQENEEMHERLRTIIYNATGGRLSYSTYTVEAVEQAFYDQLEIETEQRTKELEEENEWLKEEINIARENYGLEMEFQNMYRETLEEIKEICKCSKEMNCEECPQCDDCEELCVNDENLQDIITDKINSVLQTEESEG